MHDLICFCFIELPMGDHANMNACCMKMVCNGCTLAAARKGMSSCLFCRTKRTKGDASALAMAWERADKGEADELCYLGDKYYFARHGLTKNAPRAIELWTEAAKLGSLDAHSLLGYTY